MKQQTIKEREQCRSSKGISCYFSPFYAIAKSDFFVISGINKSPPGKGRVRCEPGKMKTVSKWLKVKHMLWSYTDSSPLELVWQILGWPRAFHQKSWFFLTERKWALVSLSFLGFGGSWDHWAWPEITCVVDSNYQHPWGLWSLQALVRTSHMIRNAFSLLQFL